MDKKHLLLLENNQLIDHITSIIDCFPTTAHPRYYSLLISCYILMRLYTVSIQCFTNYRYDPVSCVCSEKPHPPKAQNAANT